MHARIVAVALLATNAAIGLAASSGDSNEKVVRDLLQAAGLSQCFLPHVPPLQVPFSISPIAKDGTTRYDILDGKLQMTDGRVVLVTVETDGESEDMIFARGDVLHNEVRILPKLQGLYVFPKNNNPASVLLRGFRLYNHPAPQHAWVYIGYVNN